jgi:hypothetical protein
MRKSPRNALQIGENAVAPFIMQTVEGGAEELGVVHRKNLKGMNAG